MRRQYYSLLAGMAIGLAAVQPSTTVFAQETSPASWRFGVQAGANINFIGMGFQNLVGPSEGSFISFQGVDGTGIGPSFGLFGEYKSKDWWGVQLRALYDSYNGTVTDESKPSKDEFDVRMAYLTINPALRLQMGEESGLYALIGPTLAFNMSATYDYHPNGASDATLKDVETPNVKGMSLGLIAGLGYDIRTSASVGNLPLFISPFVEGGWTTQQRESSFPDDQDNFDDTWSTVSLRLGAQFKLGIPDKPQEASDQQIVRDVDVITPENGLRVLNVVEYFPMLNYVFFPEGSTAIPDRYKQVSQGDAESFSENQILKPSESISSTSVEQAGRQQDVYYNVLNIYGARMRNNPGTTIKLIGSAPENGVGETMAASIKEYLVSTFGIEESRITVTGGIKPPIPSGTTRTPQEFNSLIQEENRRVDIVTSDKDLVQPVTVRTIEAAPIDNDIVLGYNDNVKVESWQVTISGEGKSMNFGPFTDPDSRIPSSPLLGEKQEGNFHAELVVKTTDGETIAHEKDFRLFRKELDNSKTMYRYQILFNYAQSDAVRAYESFLRQELSPRIEQRSKVYVIGFTDNIGADAVNLKLSKQRASEARTILVNELGKLSNRSRVQAVGYGEDDSRALFRNTLPEGRFFNRSVVIESIPSE